MPLFFINFLDALSSGRFTTKDIAIQEEAQIRSEKIEKPKLIDSLRMYVNTPDTPSEAIKQSGTARLQNLSAISEE